MIIIILLLLLLFCLFYIQNNQIETFLIPSKKPEPIETRKTLPLNNSNNFDFLKYSYFRHEQDNIMLNYKQVTYNHPVSAVIKINNPFNFYSDGINSIDNLTIMTEIKVRKITTDNNNWYKLFHYGNNDSTVRTPGVFIHRGYLIIVASTENNWNQHIWKSDVPLHDDKKYQLIINIIGQTITIYWNQELVETITLDSKPILNGELWVGRHPKEPEGADINLTTYFTQGQIKSEYIKKYNNISQYLSILGNSI